MCVASQVKRAEPEVPELQTITQRGMTWLAEYFHQPFPFPKYDMVLIPGFPFGGMEHAGATFLREDAILFRQALYRVRIASGATLPRSTNSLISGLGILSPCAGSMISG